MKVSTKLAKNRYDFSKTHETHLLVELEAPKVEWDKERAPICIIPVLDVSGSMAGEKIEYLKKACRKLFTHLSPGDFAGIIAYDSSVYEVAPIREITQYQKDDLKEKVAKLNAGSCTNLSGGLNKAFEWINAIQLPSNVVLRVLLFTDGMANVGVTGRALVDLVKENKNRATVSAFGFGFDCQQELLADMATAGGGNYAFIDSPEAALTAFARELGGLMSTYGQDIKVTIAPDKNNGILEILNDEDVSEDGGKITVGIRDILGEEKKWIVAKVKLNSVEKPLPRKVVAFRVDVSYSDRNGQMQEIDEIPLKIRFCKPEEEPREEDTVVVQQRDRLLAAKAQAKAEEFVRRGDYASAVGAITLCCDSLTDSGTKEALNGLTANYCSAESYCSTSDINNAVRNTWGGGRVSYTSSRARGFAAGAGGQSLGSMDAMEKMFANDDDDDHNTVNQAPDATSSGQITIDPNTIDPSTLGYWISSGTSTGSSGNVSCVNTDSTAKKRSGNDW